MRTQTRAGFTLVEMMVAMALTLFVMVILSQAFVLSLETFSGMKGVGDMQVNLRTATTLLRDDLSNDHVEGKRRLSDPNIATLPPQAGFLAIHQRTAVSATVSVPAQPYFFEGNDTNGMASHRAVNHVLYMTVKRKGNRREDFFTAALTGNDNVLTPFFNAQSAYNTTSTNLSDSTLSQPWVPGLGQGGYYASQWAEVAYYLKRTGSTEEPNNPTSALGTQTFELMRAEFVMTPDGSKVSNNTNHTNGNFHRTTFKGMSCNQTAAPGNQLVFFSPADAALGARVLPSLPAFLPDSPVGAPNAVTTRVRLSETAVLPNVISFQVRIMRSDVANAPFDDVPNTGNVGRLYDTSLFTAPVNVYNNKFGLKAIQITLRVFDSGTRQTRQVTVVQDM